MSALREAVAIPGVPRAVTVVGDCLMWLAGGMGLLSLLVPPLSGALRTPILLVGPVAIGFVLLVLRRRVMVMVGLMVGLGVLGSLAVHATWDELARALVSMCGLFSFVFVTRLLELPFLKRHLDLVMAWRLSATRPQGSLLVPGAAFSFLLALPLTMGSVPLSFRALRRMFGSDGDADAAAAGLVCRAFVTSNFWTPMSPPVALALAAAGLTWLDYLPMGTGLALVGLLLIAVGPRPRGRMTEQVIPARSGRVGEFALSLGALVVLTVALQWLAPWLGSIGSTVIAVLIVVPLWEWLTRGIGSLPERVVQMAVEERPMWRDQYALLVGGSFIVTAAVHWGTETDLLSEGTPALLTILLLPVLMGLAGLLGVYPMTSLLFVCTVLPPLGEAPWDVMVVGAAMLGSTVGFVVSPLSGLTLLVAGMSRSDSLTVALRWNGPFGLGLLLIGTAGLAFVAVLLGPAL